MKTLTEKTKMKLWSYVPFSFFNESRYNRLKDNLYDFTKEGKNNYMRNLRITIAFSLAAFVYGSGSILNGTPNFTKWPKIVEAKNKEYHIERKNLEKNILDKTYNYFDSNLDGHISKKELKVGIEKVKGPDSRNFYDELNWTLKLGAKE